MNRERTGLGGLADAVVHGTAASLNGEGAGIHLLPLRRATLVATRDMVPDFIPGSEFSRANAKIVGAFLAFRGHPQVFSHQTVSSLRPFSKVLHVTGIRARPPVSIRGPPIDEIQRGPRLTTEHQEIRAEPGCFV